MTTRTRPKQLGLNVSPETFEALGRLAAIYGSRTEAIETAIAMLAYHEHMKRRETMYIYTVVFEQDGDSDPTRPAPLAFLSSLDPEAEWNFDHGDDTSDTLTVMTRVDIDAQLDTAPGVISYTRVP